MQYHKKVYAKECKLRNLFCTFSHFYYAIYILIDGLDPALHNGLRE
jgi:hypothetical protein